MFKSLSITILFFTLLFGFCSLGLDIVLKTVAVIFTIIGFLMWWCIIYGLIQVFKGL